MERLHHGGPRRVEAVPDEKGLEQTTRRIGVAGADAHGAEEHAHPLAFDDQSADSAPQHQERVRVLLVFGADPGASEFDRWSEARDQPLVVAEQVSRVKTFDASLAHDSLDVANAICAGEESRVAIPHEQMRVE